MHLPQEGNPDMAEDRQAPPARQEGHGQEGEKREEAQREDSARGSLALFKGVTGIDIILALGYSVLLAWAVMGGFGWASIICAVQIVVGLIDPSSWISADVMIVCSLFINCRNVPFWLATIFLFVAHTLVRIVKT